MKGGTNTMIRKAALQIGIPALLVLIALNAFFAVSRLKQVQQTATLALESSSIQADISAVLRDLTNMETGQRGFLLTDNSEYLQPYTEGKEKIEADIARLRGALAGRPAKERDQVAQLDELIKSKQDEIDKSISLRQHDFRLRAFKLVATNEGMGYMQSLRGILGALSTTETTRFAALDKDRAAILNEALRKTWMANLVLLLLTAFLFGLIHYYGRGLEHEAAKSRQGLAVRDLQLGRLTSALSNQARSNTSSIAANAALLLQNYGGFLPRQGHEYAEQIKEASAQMERLRQDLVASQDTYSENQAA